jgi:Secretion system C-terminal sorting domain
LNLATTANFFFRQDSPAETGALEIDELRIGTTWADVTSPVLSIKQNTIAGLNVYPNPVKDGNLYITSNSSNAKTIEVYDILGKQVLEAKTSNNAVNVSNLKGGAYIVRITEDGNTDTRKLIIE